MASIEHTVGRDTVEKGVQSEDAGSFAVHFGPNQIYPNQNVVPGSLWYSTQFV